MYFKRLFPFLLVVFLASCQDGETAISDEIDRINDRINRDIGRLDSMQYQVDEARNELDSLSGLGNR